MIKDGFVMGVAVWDGASPFDPSWCDLMDVTGMAVGPGYTYDGSAFTAPVLPEPQDEESE